MLDESIPELEIIHSIVNRMNGFLYRCRNDKAYSMMFMAGEVRRLTGHEPQAFIGPAGRSYAAQTHPDDLQAVYDAVDAALAAKDNWNVDYRIVRPDGTAIWVQEIGGGVFDGDELLYLEGAVIDADRARLAELHNVQMLEAISEKARALLGNTVPIVEVLRTLRILAINARLEAGRAGPFGASFGFVAHEVSRLAEETSVLAERIATVTGQLQDLLKAG
ncbi:PAS domain-containing protein [Stagnihabitans tardus]|uniref:histidine kinase n=1 Tax=Stagnihabitans tardus TaxID=2699202 RepID=A0AAE5BW26_9RHOB|nr:PAS domain-containing protein [Stagnihabitans tardus]NBZ88384.1 PAS domain-containing protein [Stagnihabitans tardus]